MDPTLEELWWQKTALANWKILTTYLLIDDEQLRDSDDDLIILRPTIGWYPIMIIRPGPLADQRVENINTWKGMGVWVYACTSAGTGIGPSQNVGPNIKEQKQWQLPMPRDASDLKSTSNADPIFRPCPVVPLHQLWEIKISWIWLNTTSPAGPFGQFYWPHNMWTHQCTS